MRNLRRFIEDIRNSFTQKKRRKGQRKFRKKRKGKITRRKKRKKVRKEKNVRKVKRVKKERNETKKINNSNIKCAVRNHSGKKPLSYTCFTKSELLLLKNAWNNIRRRENLPLVVSNKPKKIHHELTRYFSKENLAENEWLNHDIFKSAFKDNSDKYRGLINKYIFAPTAPSEWKKKPYTWLTNFDIEKVMKQHEHIDKTFVFIGPTPIDFDDKPNFSTCVEEKLCKFDLNKHIANGVRKIGIIFNLDKHDQSGSHWVGMFIDNDKHFVFYFDSYGIRAPPRIKKLIDRVREQSIEEMKKHREKTSTGKAKIKYTYYENDVRHQYSNTECGVYTIHMIKQLLQNKDVFMYDKKVPDKLMKSLRREYFIHKN